MIYITGLLSNKVVILISFYKVFPNEDFLNNLII